MRGFCGLAALLVGCTGEVDVYLVDRSVEQPGGELAITELFLPLERVEARRDGDWVALARGPDPYNLLDFSGEPTVVDLVTLRETPARVAHDEVPVGPISALRIVLTPGEVFEVETEDGVEHPLTVPAEAQAGWQVDAAMEIGTGEPASRTFDLRVRDAIFVEPDGTWAFVPELVPAED